MAESWDPEGPRQSGVRDVLRVVGPLVMGVGLVFTIIGFVSFFGAMGGGEPPNKFWCAFVGLPLMGFGGMITQYAFMGSVFRYMSGEVAPVGKDVVNYMAHGTRGAVRDIASAVAEGLHSTGGNAESAEPERAPEVKIRCPKCRALNDETAKFCNQCGAAV